MTRQTILTAAALAISGMAVGAAQTQTRPDQPTSTPAPATPAATPQPTTPAPDPQPSTIGPADTSRKSPGPIPTPFPAGIRPAWAPPH